MSNILTRAVEVLDLAAAAPRGLTVTDVAQAMHTNKSTASRLLASLVDAGILERDDAQRHFIDVRFWSWGAQSVRRLAVLDIARPHVATAVKQHGVSVYVAIAHENKTIYLESMALFAGYPFLNLVSYVVPVYACAPGKAILAHSSPEVIDSVLDGPLEKFTSNTFATKEELSEELQKIRKLGYAANRGEYAENDRIAIAVPVFDHTGSPVASVCFYNLGDQERVDSLVTPLLELGTTVSSSMGYAQAVRHAVG